MDKDQEILAISKLVFELTRMGGAETDLNTLLAQLFASLTTLPGIAVLPQSAILLYSPAGELVQVAQSGLPPAWGHTVQAEPPSTERATKNQLAFLCTPATHQPRLTILGIADNAPCFCLPLQTNDRLIGEALLFIVPAWQPDPVECEFMSDLGRTIAMLVARTLTNETLRVREVELEDARTDAIRRLGIASEYRDNETGMHIMRMTHFATAIAKALGLPESQRELLAICAPMHDVGKIGIADSILLKPGRLSGEEFDVMKTHTEIGSRLLMGDDLLITTAREIAVCHHERWDGSGYPAGQRGEEIPILARLCAIADVFDALTSTRPYKAAWSLEEAIDYVNAASGSHFDPAVVDAFNQALPEIRRIRELYRDDIIDPNQCISLPETVYPEGTWVVWDDSLSIGIDAIDEHHRYLFDLTNDLFNVVSAQRGIRDIARILKALNQYVQVHFRAEERMMAHYGYARIEQQHTQHGNFETRMKQFYEELHDNPLTTPFDVLTYLRSWLVKHITLEDAQLRELVGTSA